MDNSTRTIAPLCRFMPLSAVFDLLQAVSCAPCLGGLPPPRRGGAGDCCKPLQTAASALQRLLY
eukprot:48094-Alexandrium_andersonii.AAC.1